MAEDTGMSGTTVVTGKQGKIKLGAASVAITKFSIKKSGTPINVTDSESGDYEEYAPAKKIKWDGAFTGIYRKGMALPFNQVVALEGTLDTGETVTGNIIIHDEGYEVDVNNSEAVIAQRTFTGSGTLTVTTTP